MKILGIIPAKEKSTSIKNKNFRKVGNKRIIDFSLNILTKSKYITHKFVDTDSHKIAKHAEKFGIKIPFLRKKMLAKKDSPVYKTIYNSVLKLEKFYRTKFDVIILLQPTSPLRKIQDLNKAIQKFIKLKSLSLVSICQIEEPHPYKIFRIKNKKIINLIDHNKKNLNRQSLPKFYKLNGAIYILNRDFFIKNKKFISKKSDYYIMSQKNSLNLDTIEDFNLFKYYLNL